MNSRTPNKIIDSNFWENFGACFLPPPLCVPAYYPFQTLDSRGEKRAFPVFPHLSVPLGLASLIQEALISLVGVSQTLLLSNYMRKDLLTPQPFPAYLASVLVSSNEVTLRVFAIISCAFHYMALFL